MDTSRKLRSTAEKRARSGNERLETPKIVTFAIRDGTDLSRLKKEMQLYDDLMVAEAVRRGRTPFCLVGSFQTI